jgi:hypothetical protein
MQGVIAISDVGPVGPAGPEAPPPIVDIENPITDDYTITTNDLFKIKVCQNNDPITITLPSPPQIGVYVEFLKYSNTVEFTGDSGVAIITSPGNLSMGGYGRAVALVTEENEWFISFYESTEQPIPVVLDLSFTIPQTL